MQLQQVMHTWETIAHGFAVHRNLIQLSCNCNIFPWIIVNSSSTPEIKQECQSFLNTYDRILSRKHGKQKGNFHHGGWTFWQNSFLQKLNTLSFFWHETSMPNGSSKPKLNMKNPQRYELSYGKYNTRSNFPKFTQADKHISMAQWANKHWNITN